MRDSLALYGRLIGIQVRSQMQYRVSFWLELLSTGLLNGIYFLTLVFVFQRFGNVMGWTLGEVAFLSGMVEMSFAIMDLIFSGFDAGWFSNLVRMGSFDQMLLRPVNILLQIFGGCFMLRRIGRLLEGVTIFVFALSMTSIQWTAAKLAYLPVVLASQVIVFGALFMMGSTLTFWTVQPIEAMNILTYGGNEMMTYPASIYPDWLRRFFTYVIPFVFINYYPALFFLDKPDPLGMPAFAPFLAPLIAVVMFAVALWFWKFGLDHYQSTGS